MKFFVIAHNIRSSHNIGSIFRTADGAGVDMIYISGYSPSPAKEGAPYLTQAEKMIEKTALGAEKKVCWQKVHSIGKLVEKLQEENVEIVALEQAEKSIDYKSFNVISSVALIIGNEPKGVDPRILKKCDRIIEIPMRGSKKSLNVSVAFGIAAYEICSKMK